MACTPALIPLSPLFGLPWTAGSISRRGVDTSTTSDRWRWALPPSILMVLPALLANLAGQLSPWPPAVVQPTWLCTPPTWHVPTLQLGDAPSHLPALPKTPAHERCCMSPPMPMTLSLQLLRHCFLKLQSLSHIVQLVLNCFHLLILGLNVSQRRVYNSFSHSTSAARSTASACSGRASCSLTFSA